MRTLHSFLLVALLGMLVAGPADLPAQQAPDQPIAPGSDQRILLKYAAFDPLVAVPPVPATLRADAATGLWIVQFHGLVTDEDRGSLRGLGADIRIHLPQGAYVVRMDAVVAAAVARLPAIRWVGSYHPAYRLEPALLQEHLAGIVAPKRRINLLMVDKRADKAALDQKVQAIGGTVIDRHEGSPLFTVDLDGRQILAAAHLDDVLWIDRWGKPQECMDNARVQGGGNYVESVAGYTGSGIRGHVYEGVESNHPDFNLPMTNVRSDGSQTRHGHCTAGIIFGNGTSAPQARGMAPSARGFYTNYSTVTGGWSRNQVIGDLVNVHEGMFTSASWVTLANGSYGTAYTSESADADDIVFDHRIPWTQSQGNSGNQGSGMQSWAKNLISVGGVGHFNNSNPGDDSWAAGGASIGPAADGRIKPDLCAYYDVIWTSDLSFGLVNNDPQAPGTSGGYNSTADPGGQSYTGFGGTSGATPIVAGHAALAIQMFTDHIFGNSPRVPGGTRFQNRPLAQTLKALMIVSATQYPFTATSTDNRREHQGWGFPDLRTMYDRRGKTFIVPEDDVVRQGQVRTFGFHVAPGESELKVCMTFLDPMGNPNSTQASINDLSLRVLAPSGTTYWGNQGLAAGNYSSPGGSANTIDTVECVFVQNPAAGTWTVEVLATSIWQDAHVATAATDATYALAVTGGTRVFLPQYRTFATGCAGSRPASHLTALEMPSIGGNLRVDLDNLPGSQAIMITGFSNTVGQLGALPVHLGPLGLPGCWSHVSLDANQYLVGSAFHATFTMRIPWITSLLGAQFYQQALVLDWGTATGAVVSDAAEATVGVYGGAPVPDMVPIAPGSFRMGSTVVGGAAVPVHTVNITRPFWIGKYEVTQAEYLTVMNTNPSYFQPPNIPAYEPSRPVEWVTLNDAMAYCAALTVRERAANRLPAGYQYRLPTEAEWEYCCRAGTTTEYNVGSTLSCGQANYGNCVPHPTTAGGQTTVVGTYASNAWGLHDMHGNVWEWCLDWWDGSANYPAGPVSDPYVTSGRFRVARGGCWFYGAVVCRSAVRGWYVPTYGDRDSGFRVVLAPVLVP